MIEFYYIYIKIYILIYYINSNCKYLLSVKVKGFYLNKIKIII